VAVPVLRRAGGRRPVSRGCRAGDHSWLPQSRNQAFHHGERLIIRGCIHATGLQQRQGSGHISGGRLSLRGGALPENILLALVVEKVEHLVLPDRTADGTAPLLEVDWRLLGGRQSLGDEVRVVT